MVFSTVIGPRSVGAWLLFVKIRKPGGTQFMESGGNIEEGSERILLGDMVLSFEEIGILDETAVFRHSR